MKCPKCGSDAVVYLVPFALGYEACGPWGCCECHWVEGRPDVLTPPCRTCGGSGFVAVKRCIDDGMGEVDSCPTCAAGDGPTETSKTRQPEGE